MKVVAFSGSPMRKESIGNKLLIMIQKQLKEINPEIIMDIYIGSELSIGETDGTGKEFVIGKTLFKDDMQLLEKALLESNFVIFLSPVYAHQVSSYMKKFIDRLSYWLHLYKLAGRFGYVVSVSSNNGNALVNEYLRSMMEYFGLLVVGETSLETTKIESDNILKSYARFICNKILMTQNDFEINIPLVQEQNFEIQKDNFLQKIDGFERNFWDKQGYFKFDTFEELFLSRMEQKNV